MWYKKQDTIFPYNNTVTTALLSTHCTTTVFFIAIVFYALFSSCSASFTVILQSYKAPCS